MSDLAEAKPGEVWYAHLASGGKFKLVIGKWRDVPAVFIDHEFYTYLDRFPGDNPLWADATFERADV